MPSLKIKTLKGKDILPFINDLARLRITVFKEYPYLYVGDMDYETKYLQSYSNSPESNMVLVLDGDKVVGASTSMPLKDEMVDFQKPFLDYKVALDSIYYFGESVLLPEYRGQGIYPLFFEEREKAARSCGSLIAAFCAVERDANDPRRPADYKPLDSYWQRLGYRKHPELFTHTQWKEIGEDAMSDKKLTFWLKEL